MLNCDPLGTTVNFVFKASLTKFKSFTFLLSVLFLFLSENTYAQPACCSGNTLNNESFEAAIPNINYAFPTGFGTINSEYNTPSNWQYADGTNIWEAYHIYDPSRASHGDQFSYIPYSTSSVPIANYCIGNYQTENTGSSCIHDTYFNGVRYVVSYDFVPFSQNNPNGGVGSTGPRFEHVYPATTSLYDASGTDLSVLSNMTAVNWADISTSWTTANGVTPAMSTGSANFFYFSHDRFGTCGMLIDNTVIEMLLISASSATNVGCGTAPNQLTFDLSPNSNVPIGVPNIQYDITAPAGYTISPTSGVYNQNTTFTVTKNIGNFSYGSPASLDVTITDQINDDCDIIVNVSNNCFSDKDQDGIVDFIDIDWDNDGIKNLDENTACLSPDHSLIFADHWSNGVDPINVAASPATKFGNTTVSLERRDPQSILNFGANETGIYSQNGRLSYKIHQDVIVDGITDHIFKFSSPVSGLTFSVHDVDHASNYTDKITINGYFNGIAYPLTNGDITSGTTNYFSDGANSFTGTSATTLYPEGIAQASFPVPVDSIVVFYANVGLSPSSDQDIGFDLSFEFCSSFDADRDGIPDFIDLDADNDGIPDLIEAGGIDINGDGIIDNSTDFDNDGLMDIYDSAVAGGVNGIDIPNPDTDGDGKNDYLDLDADNDGLPDITEAKGIDNNGDGRVDGINVDGILTNDADQDGFTDNFDPDNDGTLGIDSGDDDQPLVETDGSGNLSNGEYGFTLDTDNDGFPDHLDLDADNDGIPDLVESNGIDQDGDGQVDVFTDTDSDGYTDIYDTKNDNVSGFGDPNDALIRASGTDTDGDGKADEAGFTYAGGNNNSLDTDGDGFLDHLDLDADNDGVPDLIEAGGLDPEGDGLVSTLGAWDDDDDGFTDIYDSEDNDTPAIKDGGNPLVQTTTDTNGDLKTYGITSEIMISGGGGTLPINSDGDSRANHLDIDADNDGIMDVTETGATDIDNDGRIDNIAANDSDQDGFLDIYDGDIGNDGSLNPSNPLITNVADNEDGDTRLEYAGNGRADTDQDDVPDFLDVDADNDGIYDNYEGQPTTTYQAPGNTDTDNDGLLDAYDLSQAAPRNGIDPYNFDSNDLPDYLDLDSDDDNIPDQQEAWDYIRDGDSQNDDTVNCNNLDTDGDGLIDCYDSAPNNALDITWIGEPADDLNGSNGTAAGTVFTDILDVLLPDNGGNDLTEPDYRDMSPACASAQVHYGITDAAATTATDFEYDGTVHNDGENSGIIRATAYCEPDADGWYYFYNPLEPDNYLLAVKNGTGSPNTLTMWDLIDYVEIKVEANRLDRHAINPTGSYLAMERDWHVVLKNTPEVGSTFDVKFYFDPAEMDSLDVAADAAEAQTIGLPTRTFQWITKNSGLQSNEVTTTGVTGSSNVSGNDPASIDDQSPNQFDGTNIQTGNGKNYVEFQGLSSLNGGTAIINISSTPLPVTLNAFSAKIEDCETKVIWSIESEENFSHFIIQSSNDGIEFKTLKLVTYDREIEAKNYEEEIPTVAISKYFRLMLVDLDGTFEYSETVLIQGECEILNSLKVAPNPTAINSQITLTYKAIEGNAKIYLSDNLGRIIFRDQQITLEGWNSYTLDLENIPAGNYYTSIDAFGRIKTEPLLIME